MLNLLSVSDSLQLLGCKVYTYGLGSSICMDWLMLYGPDSKSDFHLPSREIYFATLSIDRVSKVHRIKSRLVVFLGLTSSNWKFPLIGRFFLIDQALQCALSCRTIRGRCFPPFLLLAGRYLD